MPRFIVLEGCDLSGKSLQAKMIKQWLETERGETCLVTREPGGTEIGDKIRQLLATNPNLTEDTRATLFYAARLEHIKKIKHHKADWVVADRYFLSTEVYQQNASPQLLKAMREMVSQNLSPKLWLILDGDYATFQKRNSATRKDDLEHLEQTDETKWNELRNRYLKAAKTLSNAKIIDANPPPEKVFATIRQTIENHFNLWT